MAFGDPSLRPLVGGSAGARGGVSKGGAGGGGIQLVARRSIAIGANGVLNVGGGGGFNGGAFSELSSQNASGGGSGGAILLQSPSVSVAGVLAANGGGGGSAKAIGSDANAADVAAPGGDEASHTSLGGQGAAGAQVAGGAGLAGTEAPAGAGGGGAGRIRIETTSGVATFSGVLSPAATTPCVTQAALR